MSNYLSAIGVISQRGHELDTAVAIARFSRHTISISVICSTENSLSASVRDEAAISVVTKLCTLLILRASL